MNKPPYLNPISQQQFFVECIQRAEHALKHWSGDRPLTEWAAIQRELGCSYLNLTAGDRNENLRKAVAALLAALQVYTELDHGPFWAATQGNLGSAYRAFSGPERPACLKLALECYEAYCRVYTRQEFPKQWKNALAALSSIAEELKK